MSVNLAHMQSPAPCDMRARLLVSVFIMGCWPTGGAES